MAIVLNLETEARLQQRAPSRGENINHAVNSIISEALEWEEQDHLEAVEGIRLRLESMQ